MNKFYKNKKGIAPAIAVALLLAVTIALVAAIGYSATLVTPSAAASTPEAVFDVEIAKSGSCMGGGHVKIRHFSGDTIDTSNIKLKFVANGVTTEVLPTGNNTFMRIDENGFWPQIVIDSCTELGFLETDVVIVTNVFNAKASHFDPPEAATGWYNGYSVELFNSNSGSWVSADGPYDVDLTSLSPTYVATGEVDQFVAFNVSNVDNDEFTAIRIVSASDTIIEYNDMRDSKNWGTWEPMSLYGNDTLVSPLYEYNSPKFYLPGAEEMPQNNPDNNFGNYAISPGDVMKAQEIANSETTKIDEVDALISNWDELQKGDLVEVTIIYTPSDQVIWKGEVMVE
jgi:FlaG/FlaF family flagellin (archaellin)